MRVKVCFMCHEYIPILENDYLNMDVSIIRYVDLYHRINEGEKNLKREIKEVIDILIFHKILLQASRTGDLPIEISNKKEVIIDVCT